MVETHIKEAIKKMAPDERRAKAMVKVLELRECTFESCKAEGKVEYKVEAGTLRVCKKHVFMFEFYFAKKWGVPKEQYRYPFLYEK